MTAHLVRIVTTLGVLATLAAGPPPACADPVDDYLQAQMQERRIPGLAVGVWRHGVVVKTKGYGVASLERQAPVTASTVFDLGGLTKQFTATAIMVLVEQGKLGLDDPIVRSLHDAPPAWRPITVRHLLTHTAGFPGRGQGFKALQTGGLRPSYTTAELTSAAKTDALSFPPGEGAQYSDVGYFLLGLIIEKVTGRRYQDVLTEGFFRPLGMDATALSRQEASATARADVYTLRDGHLRPLGLDVRLEMPSFYGAFSTVQDLLRWESALARGAVVPRRSLDEMWTPARLNDGTAGRYGLGVQVTSRWGHRMLVQSGITGTEWVRFPDDGVTVVVLTNLGLVPGGLAPSVAAHFIPGRDP